VTARLVRQIYGLRQQRTAPTCSAVVVPTRTRCRTSGDIESLRPLISDSLKDVARTAGLQSYESHAAVIVETTPFRSRTACSPASANWRAPNSSH